jgi:serine/threonine protein kinase
MGVVGKARDTHFDQFVALKTLTPERLGDPERKRRSLQEPKAASALNHANIGHIPEADEVQYISMEYVPGKTLGELIRRKGLRLSEALKYAVQIADALAITISTATQHGIRAHDEPPLLGIARRPTRGHSIARHAPIQAGISGFPLDQAVDVYAKLKAGQIRGRAVW